MFAQRQIIIALLNLWFNSFRYLGQGLNASMLKLDFTVNCSQTDPSLRPKTLGEVIVQKRLLGDNEF